MAIPKPFSRPRVEVSRQRRSWQHVPVEDIMPGDTVTDIGQILKVVNEAGGVILYNVHNRASPPIPYHRTVYAFVMP